jgi:SOS-response transcriptional repressor LexA
MPIQAHPLPLGQRIKAARKAADYTLVEVSQRIGISNQALSAIERGQKNPSKQTLMNLARVLHDSFGIDWLEKETEEESQHSRVFFDEFYRRGDKENLQNAFNEFLEFKFGTDSIAVKDFAEGARLIPLRARIAAGMIIEEPNSEEKFFIPASMARRGKTTFAIQVQDNSLSDSLVGAGDLLIANYDTSMADGKCALVEVQGKVFLTHIALKGRSVTLSPAYADQAPFKVSRSHVICICEVTGLLRFIS